MSSDPIIEVPYVPSWATDERHRFVNEKDPYIGNIMRRASSWSQEMGWRPGDSDK